MKNNLSFSFQVTEDHIDQLNHVNNVVYLQWVLKAAEKHWGALSAPAMNDKYVWVVLRHEIDYLASGMLGDEITVTTWIGESIRVRSDRFVEIKKGDKILAKAKTIWCLLDKKTMKPARIPAEILTILN